MSLNDLAGIGWLPIALEKCTGNKWTKWELYFYKYSNEITAEGN